jgi:hypothetical protein
MCWGNSMKRSAFLLIVLLVASARPLFAGPPFQLDDPDVIPYQDFEFYLWGGASSTPGVINTSGPAIEFNYSGVRNVMFHYILPAGTTIPSSGPSYFGLEDSEFGVQYRFIQETKHRPMIGTFIMTEIPTGNSNKGLGAGGPSWKIPLWAQKTIKGWTIDGGGGEAVSDNIEGALNYPFGGTLILHDVGKKLTLGTELFFHDKEDVDPSSRYAAMIDVGGYYTPTRNPNFQLLFAYGHSIAGQPETYAYAALYWAGNLHKRLQSIARHLHP